MIFFKKLYYTRYKKSSYSIFNVDLIIDRIFLKLKKKEFMLILEKKHHLITLSNIITLTFC